MYSIGKVFKRDGKKIYITSGYFTDPEYGRISNHWSWREVNKDGTLGKKGNGYGDTKAKPLDVTIETTIKL